MEIKMNALDRYMVMGLDYRGKKTKIVYFDDYLDAVHCLRCMTGVQHACLFERTSISKESNHIAGVYKEIFLPEEM